MRTYHCTPGSTAAICRITAIAVLCLILTSPSVPARDSDGFRGPNLLRSNPDVSLYVENGKGQPGIVRGRLSSATAQGREVTASLEFFTAYAAAYRMDNPEQQLRAGRMDIDALGMRHVRFEQVHNGLRVIGGDLVTHFDADGVLRTVNGSFLPDITAPVGATVDSDRAIQLAQTDLKDIFGPGEPTQSELVIFPWESNTYLAWRFYLLSDTPMGRWEYFVDAVTGEIIYRANRIMNDTETEVIGTGVGVMGQPRSHIDVDLQGGTYYMYDYTRQANNNLHGHDGQMPDSNYIQTNIADASLPGSIATDENNIWDDRTIQSPAVDGHVYTVLMYDYLLHEFERNGYDDAGATMLTVVNYSAEGDDNAYWDGRRIVVWSWSPGWRSLAGCPDVIAHEWGHAVTDFASNLAYQKEPGALNESFSDMIGAAFEWAHPAYDSPDWFIGENGMLEGDGFRDMAQPHARSDPDYYGTSDPYWIDVENCTPSWTNDYCGVHTNSGVGNKWFHLVAEGGVHYDLSVTGIGVENAMRIAYRANVYYWTSTTDYHDAALTTVAAADDLDSTGAWGAVVARAWQAVGVTSPTPTLNFEYPGGVPDVLPPGDTTSFVVTVSGELGGTPVPGSGILHYSVDGAPYVSTSMIEQSASTYVATLPGLNCNAKVRFYVSAEEAAFGTVVDPDSAKPFMAIVATDSATVFQDNFETDNNWTVSGTATDGQWERAIPAGGGDRGDPPADYDGSGFCFVTDNADDNSDVDEGSTILTSPSFSITSGKTRVSYARWYSNNIGADPHNDVFEVFISNNGGISWTPVEVVGPLYESNGGWIEHSFWVEDLIPPGTSMKLRFVASDVATGSVIEAGVDAVRVTQYECAFPHPAIQSDSLPDWTLGVAYSHQLSATGGTGGLVWSDKQGDLVGTGLTLSASGLLSGIPTQEGDVSFIAQVTDENNQTDELTVSFYVNPAVLITTEALPDWTAGVPYSVQLTSTGGTGTLSWVDVDAGLAGIGLALSEPGEVSGVPVSAGSFSFTALAGDEVGGSDQKPLTVTINPMVRIDTQSLPTATVGKSYSYHVSGSGGTGGLTWSDKLGLLTPLGLSLDGSGTISGTPADTATLALVIVAADSVGSADETTMPLAIAPLYLCGDINNDGIGPDISDLSALVNYLFVDGSPPPILEAANVDGAGIIDISDLALLVNHLFVSAAPLACN